MLCAAARQPALLRCATVAASSASLTLHLLRYAWSPRSPLLRVPLNGGLGGLPIAQSSSSRTSCCTGSNTCGFPPLCFDQSKVTPQYKAPSVRPVRSPLKARVWKMFCGDDIGGTRLGVFSTECDHEAARCAASFLLRPSVSRRSTQGAGPRTPKPWQQGGRGSRRRPHALPRESPRTRARAAAVRLYVPRCCRGHPASCKPGCRKCKIPRETPAPRRRASLKP